MYLEVLLGILSFLVLESEEDFLSIGVVLDLAGFVRRLNVLYVNLLFGDFVD